jgi:hypothetical protein
MTEGFFVFLVAVLRGKFTTEYIEYTKIYFRWVLLRLLLRLRSVQGLVQHKSLRHCVENSPQSTQSTQRFTLDGFFFASLRALFIASLRGKFTTEYTEVYFRWVFFVALRGNEPQLHAKAQGRTAFFYSGKPFLAQQVMVCISMLSSLPPP